MNQVKGGVEEEGKPVVHPFARPILHPGIG